MSLLVVVECFREPRDDLLGIKGKEVPELKTTSIQIPVWGGHEVKVYFIRHSLKVGPQHSLLVLC